MRPGAAIPEQRSVFRVGKIQFDEARSELLVEGQRRPLEAKPLALLSALLAHNGAVASKRELIRAAWGNADHISEASLTTAMSKLRAALGESGRDIVEVVHGSGYRIAVPVEVAAAREQARLAFAFNPGDAVPGRPQWRLEGLLGPAPLRDVWLARHAKTREARVFKFADSVERLETLRREAALSRVLHATLGDRDDLARILEWNFDERPYFIESRYGGTDLPAWVEARGGLGAWPEDERAGLVARVARTIAAAHAAGVLHGDIKPANILVEGEPGSAARVRLVDFGAGGLSGAGRPPSLALSVQSLDEAAGERGTGTLRYMPPEVLAGGVPTTGADIYALGILLYQLVTGDLHKPLAVGWEADVADGLLRADIASAASGDAQRRLASAAGLAERLETLPARRQALREQEEQAARAALLARRVERDRLLRPWVAAAAVSLIAGLAFSTFFAIRAAHDRDEASRRAALAQAVNAFLTQDLFGRGNPAQSGKPDETLMEAAQAAEAGIDRRLAGEPMVAGALYLSLANAFDARSAFDAARQAYDHAVAAFEKAGRAGQASAVVARLHEAMLEVISEQPHAVARAKALLAEAEPMIAGLGSRAGEAQVWLGASRSLLAMVAGDMAGARAGFRLAADRADAMPEIFDEGSRLDLRRREAFAAMRLGDLGAAQALLSSLLQRRLVLDGPRHPATLQVALNLAQVRIGLGQSKAALPEFDRLYPVVVAVFGADHRLTLQLLATRAQALGQLERYDDALADQMTLYRSAVAKRGALSFFALGSLADAAQSQCRAGHDEAGVAAARTAYDGALGSFGEGSPVTATAAENLAFCLVAAKQYALAVPMLGWIESHILPHMASEPTYGAEIGLMRANVALATGDKAYGERALGRVSAQFEAPATDVYMQKWARRLERR